MRWSWWILSPALSKGHSDDKVGEKAEVYEAAVAC